MSALRFRNLDVSPEAPVEDWPFEGVVTAIERGTLPDWQRLAAAIKAEPWGQVARYVTEALQVVRPYGVAPLMESVVERARSRAEHSERAEVARRVAALLARSLLSRQGFAERLGTSASRLSTYLTGRVVPSAALLVRMERLASSQEDSR
jgi:DNA-binding transcriptional regulator YiaG